MVLAIGAAVRDSSCVLALIMRFPPPPLLAAKSTWLAPLCNHPKSPPALRLLAGSALRIGLSRESSADDLPPLATFLPTTRGLAGQQHFQNRAANPDPEC